MAIFGAGSIHGHKDEKKDEFFADEKYVIGWGLYDARDLFNMISSIKAGDIIYLKTNPPGSLDIRVKGIGIVKQNSLTFALTEKDKNPDSPNTVDYFKLPVKWIHKEEFIISIPQDDGKLTNVRSATLYEEFLPHVHDEIIDKIVGNRAL